MTAETRLLNELVNQSLSDLEELTRDRNFWMRRANELEKRNIWLTEQYNSMYNRNVNLTRHLAQLQRLLMEEKAAVRAHAEAAEAATGDKSWAEILDHYLENPQLQTQGESAHI